MFNVGKKTSDHYASFNRRMWAATVDSLLFLLLILPVAEMLFSYVYPLPDAFYALDFWQEYAKQSGSIGALVMLWDHSVASGFFQRWLADTGMQIAIIFIASAFCWKRWSATPGKMLFKLKVVDADTEQPISNQQILLRLCGYIVASLPLFLGLVWIIFSKRRQGWHDKMANTVVIIKPNS